MLKIVDHLCTQHGLRYWLDGGTLLGAVRHHGFIPWDDDIDLVMPRRDFDKFLNIARSALPDDIEMDTATGSSEDRSFNIPCRLRDKFSRIEKTHSPDNLGLGLFIDIIPSDVYHQTPPWLTIEVAYKRFYSNATKVYDLFRKIRMRGTGFVGMALNILPLAGLAKYGLRLLNSFSRTFLMRNRFQLADIGSPGYGYDVRWTRIFKREDIYPLQRIRFEDADFLAPHNTDGVLKVFYGPDYMTPPDISMRSSKHLQTLTLDTRLGDRPVPVE